MAIEAARTAPTSCAPWLRALAAVSLGLALILSAFTARADAIPPPPACPPGARGVALHDGEWCEPAPCTSDTDCREGTGTCRPWRVCTRLYSIKPGGLRPDDPPPRDVALVVGSCSQAQACTGEEEPPPPTAGRAQAGPTQCRDGDYCVPASLPSLPSAGAPGSATKGPASRRSCGCRVGVPASGLGGGLGLGLLWIWIRRRRR